MPGSVPSLRTGAIFAAGVFWFALFLSSLSPSTAGAQYSFSVPVVTMECRINPDASVRIHYRIQFVNAPYARAVDVVDIGLPHDEYDIRTMNAWLDGTPVYGISPSTYIETGVEVNLGLGIAGGRAGTFEFEATMPDLVFSDTTSDELASFQMTPTWFDSGLLQGSTDLRIAIHLPPGVAPEDVLHQGVEFENKVLVDDHAVVSFHYPSTRFDHEHLVGISFPRSAMTRVVEITMWDLLAKWWLDHPAQRAIAGLLFALLCLLFFMRFTGFTGWSVFLFFGAVAGVIFYNFPMVQLWAMPASVPLFALLEWRTQKRKRTYLPPIASVEGGGIKRGLTAPEAAVLLEMPLGRVLTLVIFGMLRKGLVRTVTLKPLQVEVIPGLAKAKSKKERRKDAAGLGKVVHNYEHGFLDALVSNAGFPVQETSFGDAVRDLVSHVADRVTGFDVDETRKYYRHQVQRAWTEAEAIGEVDLRAKKVDEKLEWMLLDDDYDDRFGAWGRGGYWYRPAWGYGANTGAGLPNVADAVAGAVGGGGAGGGGGGGGALQHTTTSFGDVAAGFAGWTERVTGQLSNAIRPGDVRADAGKGVIDLSGADKVTGDILSALASSGGGGGGGGGGGCACACAGCACACACAGGGR